MKLNKILGMQRELDTFIAKEKNLGDPYNKRFLPKRVLALRVEIGELANETRCFKYWSTKGPSEKQRVMDEAADVLHFILSIINLENIEIKNDLGEVENYVKEMFLLDANIDLTDGFNAMYKMVDNSDWEGVLINLIAVVVLLGYSLKDLEGAYLVKNLENYKRQKTNY